MPSHRDSHATIVALADHPTHKSFGIFAPVWRLSDTHFAMSQLTGDPNAPPKAPRPLAPSDLEHGYALGGLRRLEHPIPDVPLSHVAFWQGAYPRSVLQNPELSTFAWRTPHTTPRYTAQGTAASRFDVAPHPTGHFALAPEPLWLDRREAWLKDALAWLARHTQPATSPELDIARLMRRLNPFDPRTQAALWYAYRDTPQQDRHTAWIARTRRDAGDPVEPSDLIASFTRIIQDAAPPHRTAPARPLAYRLPDRPQHALTPAAL